MTTSFDPSRELIRCDCGKEILKKNLHIHVATPSHHDRLNRKLNPIPENQTLNDLQDDDDDKPKKITLKSLADDNDELFEDNDIIKEMLNEIYEKLFGVKFVSKLFPLEPEEEAPKEIIL